MAQVLRDASVNSLSRVARFGQRCRIELARCDSSRRATETDQTSAGAVHLCIVLLAVDSGECAVVRGEIAIAPLARRIDRREPRQPLDEAPEVVLV